jgi:hypothetical protein
MEGRTNVDDNFPWRFDHFVSVELGEVVVSQRGSSALDYMYFSFGQQGQ